MGIYLLLLIWLLVIQFLKKNIVIYLLTYFFLLFLGGLRGIEVGTDTVNYLTIYENLKTEDGSEFVMSYIEPLWVLLNKGVILSVDEYQVVIFVGILLSVTPVFIRVWKSCSRPYFAILFYVLLYFYFNAYNVTRQMIAISIVFYALPFVENRQYKKYVLAVFIAMMFHFTAVLAFLIPLIKKIKLSTNLVLALLPFTYVCGVWVFPKVISFIPIISKYEGYLLDGEATVSITRLLLNALFIVTLVFSDIKSKSLYMAMFFVGILFYNLFAFNSVLGRCALYFTVAQLIVFANMNSSFRGNIVCLKGGVLFYGLFYYITMLNTNMAEIVPYFIFL